MNLESFNSLIGQDSYVRCQDKERIDPAIVNYKMAVNHLRSGGTVGWWIKSGYIVVDIDEGKKEALEVIKSLGLKTLMCKTPKGVHLYFRTDKEYPQRIGMTLPCGLRCDFRCANKGYVLLPYNTENRVFNKVQDIIEMPLEFTPIPNRKESLLGKKEGEGRNTLLFNHLMSYKNRGATETQIRNMANMINTYIFKEPMPADELEKILGNTTKYAAQQLEENPYLLYNSKGHPMGVNNRAINDYFVNKGDIFVIGGECYQYREGIYVEASSYVRNTVKEMIGLDHLITQSRIMECYRLLIDDTRIQKSAYDLNTDKNLINFTNGVWNIERKKLLPHDSKYLQTIQLPHEVTKPPSWGKTKLHTFLTEQLELPDDEMEMLLSYMAYSMTLDAGLKTFMVLQGPSNTGKSVLIRFFETLVGTCNTAALSMHELNMRFYPAQLYNKLLNSCADNGSLPLSSIENLKKITGGDQIMHEKKGREPFFFVSFAKLLFSFNQLPLQLEEKSNAFYLRMRILSMQKQLYLDNAYVDSLCAQDSIAEVIPHLLKRLPIKEIPRTESSDKLVENLRQDSDSIHAFMSSCCLLGGKRWVAKKDLYDAYTAYCTESGKESHRKHTFMRHIRAQGYDEARHPNTREACWKGISIKKEK